MAGALFTVAGTAAAQTPVSVADSASQVKAVPGNLFSTPELLNTAAVSTASGEQLQKTPTANLTNTLSGLLPGLTLKQGTGEPWNDQAQWLIRGIGTYNFGGYNTCKIYVDGFEVNANYMQYLKPAEIESISILKDAAALSTFGERGGNGVIWIETKRGQIGPLKIKTNVRYGIQMPTAEKKPLNSYEFGALYNQAISNDNGFNPSLYPDNSGMQWTPTYTNDDLEAYKNGTGINVDWYDEVMRKNGQYVDGDVSFTGGSKSARYNILLGYMNQQGLFDVKNSDKTSNEHFGRYNIRANFDFDILKIFEARVDLGGRIEEYKRPGTRDFGVSNIMNVLATYPSNIYNVFDDEAMQNYSGTAIYNNNPVASIKQLGWFSNHARTIQGNFSLKEKLDFITPGLYLKETFSFTTYTKSAYSKTRNYARYHNGVTTTTDQNTSITASGYGSEGMEDWKQGAITLGYDRVFGKHALTAVANMHISGYNGDGLYSYKYHYVNYNGRVNYNYDNRYVAEFGFSYFGNDSYAPGHQYAFYPTISAAWMLSNEEFLKNSSVVDMLKLRVSAGKTGISDSNNSVGGYSTNGRFLYKSYFGGTSIGAFYTGNSTPNQQGTLGHVFIPYLDAHAEKSMKYNVGIDAALFQGLNVSADFYLDKRTDILTADNSIMQYFGVNNKIGNIGKMTSKGFEIAASYTKELKDWSYTINGMASYNTNKIDYMSETPRAHKYNEQTGRAYGTPLGLVADGFYDVDDFNADGTLKAELPTPMFGNVQPGDIKYKDLDNNGIVDTDDETAIGNSIYPKWTYSFGATIRYKSFDLGFLFQGAAGADFNLLDNWNQTVAFVNNGNAYDIARGAWAYFPEQGIDTRASATYPRLTTESNDNNFRASTFWMRSLNYLKLRNVELGYTFTPKGPNPGIDGLRIYLSAVNPFVFSKLYKDFDLDPEAPYGGYPAIRSYNIGVSLTF